jgi:hypothetical protein
MTNDQAEMTKGKIGHFGLVIGHSPTDQLTYSANR